MVAVGIGPGGATARGVEAKEEQTALAGAELH